MRAGEGAAARRVEKRLASIDALNDRLRALITVTGEEARAAARRQDEAVDSGRYEGELAGLTVSLKDVIHTAGVRTTNGSDIDRDFVPAEDAEVVRRLKAQGAILIGKANLHEYAYGGTTQNPFHGSCRNPWDPERIPGGSSGGSACAVASDMSCVSLGTDTAGSGRLPGALCGVAALRPTTGAIPNRGVTTVSAFFDTISPLARRVVDIAAVFRCLAGHDPLDPFSVDHPLADGLGTLDGRVEGLRLGIPRSYFFEGVSDGVGACVKGALAELQHLGAVLTEIELPGAGQTPPFFERLFHTDCAYELSDTLARHGDRLGADTRERLTSLGGTVSGVAYAEALAEMRVWQWQLRQAFSAVDVIVHPTAPIVAPTLAEISGTTAATRRLAVFLYPWALAQVPVLSVPVGFAEHQMPCGMSIAAPWWREDILFRIGDAYQRRTDWHLRKAPMLQDRA